MIAVIQNRGNNPYVSLPKVYLDDLNVKEGNEVEIIKQGNTIIIKPAIQKRKTIQELFANYNEDYTPEKIDWGNPVGGEIW